MSLHTTPPLQPCTLILTLTLTLTLALALALTLALALALALARAPVELADAARAAAVHTELLGVGERGVTRPPLALLSEPTGQAVASGLALLGRGRG